MEKDVRKSKIYTYFHGASTVFQQFVIAAGILFILLGFVAQQSHSVKITNAREKYNDLSSVASDLEETYSDLYYEYTTGDQYNFNCESYEEAEIVENDKNADAKKAHNDALKAYNDAVKNAEAAKKEYESSELYLAAETAKDEYLDIFYDYYYYIDCTKYEAVTIGANDSFIIAKTAYNNALNAYNEAVKKAESPENSAYAKYSEHTVLIEELKGKYEKLYKEYSEGANYHFVCTKSEEVEIAENDKYAEEKTALNKALKEYNKAAEKAEKAKNKYDSLAGSDSVISVIFIIIGILACLAGIIWSFIKKFSFDKKSCEEAYDEEIQVKIEEAKEKALEKLNIVAEQIEKVDPVVLNGIASYDSGANKNPVGKIALLFQGVIGLFSSIEVVLLGALIAAAYSGISLIFGSAFFIPALGAIALVAFFGMKLYNKYEKEFYVNPKTISKLENLYPNLVVKLGTDDNIRVSLPAITVYMFGDEQIYMYYQYFDVVTGKIFCEGIHEYFYEDVVGVVSAQETKKLFKRTGFLKLFVKAMDYLKESITVVSSGCQHSESYIVPMGESLLDTSFVGMRNLIRQKKSER